MKSRRKKIAKYLSYADLDHTCRNPTRHDVIAFDPPQCRVSSLCTATFLQALHRNGVYLCSLMVISQAMKADQASEIVIIQRKLTAFREVNNDQRAISLFWIKNGVQLI